MYLVPNIHPGTGGASPPTVQANFATSTGDWTSVSTLSSMPSGGSVSRSGQAMLYDSTGKLTYAPNNVLTYSEQFDNASWNKLNSTVTADATTAPDGTSTADKLIETTATGTHSVYRTMADTYIISVYAKAAERTIISIGNGTDAQYAVFNLSAGTVTSAGSGTISSGSITSVGSGWYRCSCKFTYSGTTKSLGIALRDASGALNYTGDGTSGLYVWGAQLEAVTYQTTPSTYVATTTAAYYGPRFDYDPSTLAAKGLLIEGTRTNLCVYSQTTSDANWTVTGGAKTSTNNDDPFGTSTAMLFTASATTTHFIGAGSYSYTSGTVYCGSCFVKAGTASLVQFTFNTGPFGSSQYANFNLSGAGSVTASSGGTGYITQLANGWYRIAFSAPATATAASAAGVIALISSTTDARLPSFASTGTIYATGWQLEIGAFPTSYIPVPTTGSTARAAETFSITGYTNRLLEAYYIDEQTGGSYSGNSTVVSSGAVTISPPTFGWVTSLRAYTNAYAGSIASPSWLSFSRSGNAMMTDSTGTLTYAPANMITYSQDVTNAAWNKTFVTASTSGVAPDGTSTASLVAETTANNVHYTHTSNVVFSVGDVCLASVYLKKGNGVTAPNIIQLLLTSAFPALNYANFNISSGTVTASSGLTANIVDAGNGWWRCSVYSTATSTVTSYGLLVAFVNDNATATRGPTYTGSTTSNVYIWGAQVERVTYQTQPSAYIPTTTAAVYGPRYDYDASTVPAQPRGLLIEESRSNLLTYSEQFDNAAWTKVRCTITANATIAPDGTSSADRIVEDTTNNSRFISQTIASVASGQAVAVSCYAKASGRDIFAIVTADSASVFRTTYFNISTGTIGTVASGHTASIQNLGNGWYRCTIVQTQSSPTGAFIVYPSLCAVNGSTTYTGDGVSGIYLWGAQLEAGSFATSYIPTTSASVTRAADVAQLTGSALTTLQGTNFSALTEFTLTNPSATGSGSGRFIGLTAATAFDSPFFANGTTQIMSYANSTNLAANVTLTAKARVGYAQSSSGRSLVGNNGTVTTDANSISSVTAAYIGSRNAQFAVGWYGSVALYNQRLPDAILKQKSAIGAPY